MRSRRPQRCGLNPQPWLRRSLSSEYQRTLSNCHFEGHGKTFAIPIKIRKARGANYDFSCASSEPDLDLVEINRRLNRSGLSWPRPFRVIFASPIAALQTTEEFLTPGKVESIVRRRRSAEVLRNRLFRLHANANKFQLFKDNVGYVLNGSRQGFEIKVSGDPGRDVLVKALACTSSNDRLRDLSLLGSGSLQIIEILLNLYLDPSDLNLVLLDEPDSHIHRDIQRRLLEVIETKTEHTQVFATTHNESLLSNISWDRVFHFTFAPVGTPCEFRPIANSHVIAKGRHHGLLVDRGRKRCHNSVSARLQRVLSTNSPPRSNRQSRP